MFAIAQIMNKTILMSSQTKSSHHFQQIVETVDRQIFMDPDRFTPEKRSGKCIFTPWIAKAFKELNLNSMAFTTIDLPKYLFTIKFHHCFNIVKVPQEGFAIVDLTISQLLLTTPIPLNLEDFFHSLCFKGYSFFGKDEKNLYKYLCLITGCSEEKMSQFFNSKSIIFNLDKRRNLSDVEENKYWGSIDIKEKS
ncbi:MAG: hypothetical protein QNJ31_03405 [Candidatus Caenarcaniphilales bacterium]|nr:hypothetical protein [Candidatus Caenarcaniphilales bacterium]